MQSPGSPKSTVPAQRVRPIPWLVDEGAGGLTHHAQTVVGYYAAWEDRGEGRVIVPHATSYRPAGRSAEDAKAAAQADYEARIISALLDAPPSTADFPMPLPRTAGQG